MRTDLITEKQYQKIREYEESTSFSFDTLHSKYKNPFSYYPSKEITACSDVIIAGGGPSGLMFGLYLAQRGIDSIIIEPREIGYTSREWNISLEEILQLTCILSEEEIQGCLSGRIVSEGNIQFLDLFTYRSSKVLDRIVDTEKILKLLEHKICSCQSKPGEKIFFKTHYENFRIKDDKIAVLTRDGRIIEGKLFLHGMGSQDEISFYENHDMEKAYYNIVGIFGRIGETKKPKGDIIHTLEDAIYGPDKQQIVWELFMSEEPQSDDATIYVFDMEKKKGSLVALMKYFEKNFYSYIQTDIIDVKKILFGYIELPDDVTGMTRSLFPRVYSIGEGNINSAASGCGFAMCIKSLNHIGSQLVKVLKKDNGSPEKMSAKILNRIMPDTRQLCSISIEQLMKEILLRGDNESFEKPNLHSAAMFELFSLVRYEKERNDMLKCVMRPHLLLEALLHVKSETNYTISTFFDILKSNNGDLLQRMNLIVSNYRQLIFCEIKEIIKHLYFSLLFRKSQFTKSCRHIRNIYRAHPLKFYSIHRFLKKQAIQNMK